ncbi:MAG: 4-(cytidine 5'-diphospho)-2-C-methyl-D-erythritol kinase [bacterium]|nr:4-(cytidine 5'-diphospho)-2-C-methyl-D-erythritol kinase [bacterium]
MLSLRAHAKVNFGLSVRERRKDGYHNIESVFQKIDLYDEIHIEKTESETIFDTNSLPYEENNICHRVIERFLDLSNVEGGVRVHLQKNIWLGSGLGGASSDAATLLQGLNRMYEYPLEKDALFEIATSLGSDVPFFLNGNTAIVGGRGDIILPLHIQLPLYLVLVYPGFEIKTEWAYRAIDEGKTGERKGVESVVKSLEEGDIDGFASALFNDFEKVVFKKYPVIAEIKEKLLRSGCIGTSLSGSGSVIYGIMREREDEEGWKRCIVSEDVRVVKCL